MEENKFIDENNSENEQQENKISNKCVYISGIPYDASLEQIQEIFTPCGVIKEIKLPKYQDSGRNRGYAHIYFKKNKSVQKALEKNKTYIGSRYITVELSKGENSKNSKIILILDERKADGMEVPVGCTTIFIKNLPYDVTEDEVGDKFKPCGDIKSIRFVYNTIHNHFKGFAYIQFESTDAVIKALKLNNKPIKGRNMIVDFEESGPKMGYKYRTEKPSKFNKDYKEIVQKSLQKKRKRADK